MRVPHMRFTIRWFMAIVAGVGVTFWLVRPLSSIAICDGICTYSIHVQSSLRTPIRRVTCEAFSTAREAAHSLEGLLAPETRLWSAQADPFVGQPLSVSLPFTFRTSRGGQVIDDVQYRFLLVIVQFHDGSRMGKVVELPHRDKANTVRVVIP